MKPCSDKKRSLTLLAAGALDAPAARELHTHLQACPRCHEYLVEMETLCGTIQQTAATVPPVDPSPYFHAKLERAVANSTLAPAGLVALLTRWRRWVQPAGLSFALLAAVAVAMILTRPPTDRPQPHIAQVNTTPSTTVAMPAAPADIAQTTTLLAYHRAFVESFQELDDLMTHNETHAPQPFGTTALSLRPNFSH